MIDTLRLTTSYVVNEKNIQREMSNSDKWTNLISRTVRKPFD